MPDLDIFMEETTSNCLLSQDNFIEFCFKHPLFGLFDP